MAAVQLEAKTLEYSIIIKQWIYRLNTFKIMLTSFYSFTFLYRSAKLISYYEVALEVSPNIHEVIQYSSGRYNQRVQQPQHSSNKYIRSSKFKNKMFQEINAYLSKNHLVKPFLAHQQLCTQYLTSMQFLGLQGCQAYKLTEMISNYIFNLQSQIQQKFDIKLRLSQLFGIIVEHFKNRHDAEDQEIILTFLLIFYQGNNQVESIQALQSTIMGRNFAGHIITCKDDEHYGKMLIQYAKMASFYSEQEESSQINTFKQKLFQERFQQIASDFTNMRHKALNQVIHNINITIYNWKSRQKYKKLALLARNWKFDKEQIDSYFQYIKDNKDLSVKKQAINLLYNELIQQNSNNNQKYIAYQLIQYLITISDKSFKTEFNIHIIEDVVQLVQLLKNDIVISLSELEIRQNVLKHLEQSSIKINFSDIFNINDIQSKNIINILDNVDNRLFLIDANKNFIMTRNVSTNQTAIIELTDNNVEAIQSLIQQCANDDLYDVAIRSNKKYESVGKIKMRYFSYLYTENSCINVALQYPQDIVSLSVRKVKIINMNKCANLKNLYSFVNTYEKLDISSLKSIKRLLSSNDTYINNDSCFLQDIFQHNKLEYLSVQSKGPNDNIVNNVSLSKNIGNMKYIDIYQDGLIEQFQLSIFTEQPTNLRVFNVYRQNDNGIKYHGTVRGTQEQVDGLRSRLLHNLQSKVVTGTNQGCKVM